jgi:hypothetical protein
MHVLKSPSIQNRSVSGDQKRAAQTSGRVEAIYSRRQGTEVGQAGFMGNGCVNSQDVSGGNEGASSQDACAWWLNTKRSDEYDLLAPALIHLIELYGKSSCDATIDEYSRRGGIQGSAQDDFTSSATRSLPDTEAVPSAKEEDTQQLRGILTTVCSDLLRRATQEDLPTGGRRRSLSLEKVDDVGASGLATQVVVDASGLVGVNTPVINSCDRLGTSDIRVKAIYSDSCPETTFRVRPGYTGDGSGCWTSEEEAAWIAKSVSFMEVFDCEQCKETAWCEGNLVSPRVLQLIQGASSYDTKKAGQGSRKTPENTTAVVVPEETQKTCDGIPEVVPEETVVGAGGVESCIPSIGMSSSFPFQTKTEFFPAHELQRRREKDLLGRFSSRRLGFRVDRRDFVESGESDLLSPRILQLVDIDGKLCK